jgi:hypothetical protein
MDIIDNNPDYKAAVALFRQGDIEKARQLEKEFLEKTSRLEDHCPCTYACRWHGKCKECVILHRGHQDHLPKCMVPLLDEHLRALARILERELVAQA